MKDTEAKTKLIKHLKKRNPQLSEQDLSLVLESFRRFVLVMQKIYSEPQAQVIYKQIKKKDYRIINTDLEELSKVLDHKKNSEPIRDVFEKLRKAVTKDKS